MEQIKLMSWQVTKIKKIIEMLEKSPGFNLWQDDYKSALKSLDSECHKIIYK